ncbi:hypothetical protein [Glutamicibacter protophormiae]|uniref:hypothetical protein n=1 Tax=Glutamicibacter protophormiae TaxID=37930 RepID=UPI001AE8416B|nr:hypothetical protein [Glutamicibacter protophormiae]
MQLASASNPPAEDPTHDVDAYRDYLAARGHGSKPAFSGARTFMARWPQPEDWLDEPLAQRTETKKTHDGVYLLLDAQRQVAWGLRVSSGNQTHQHSQRLHGPSIRS